MHRDYGIVAVIKSSDGKYLLFKERKGRLKNHWAPPHGTAEISDKDEQACVARELYEEAGLHSSNMQKLASLEADHKVKTVSFWAVAVNIDQLKVNPQSTTEFGWFSIDEALQLKLYPATRVFFESIKSGKIKIPII